MKIFKNTKYSNPYSNNIWTQVGPVNVPIQGNGDKRGIGRVNAISFHLHPTDPNGCIGGFQYRV